MLVRSQLYKCAHTVHYLLYVRLTVSDIQLSRAKSNLCLASWVGANCKRRSGHPERRTAIMYWAGYYADNNCARSVWKYCKGFAACTPTMPARRAGTVDGLVFNSCSTVRVYVHALYYVRIRIQFCPNPPLSSDSLK